MRKFFRGLGKFFWRFMVIFSFIVNMVLVVVILVLLTQLFAIKDNIATPLVTGLHSSFVGLDQATIDWTIPVDAIVPVELTIPLEQDTVVTLTEAVPLSVVANINAPGLSVYGATVNLDLPKDLELPVKLDLDVEVSDTIPVKLDVRAVIPLQETQLHDVADSLRVLFEPLAVGLTNLPDDFGGAIQMVGDSLGGNPPNLLEANAYSANPWPGFSRTAGYQYDAELLTANVPDTNQPVDTGIVTLGGIPALDEQMRPELYENDMTPAEINAQATQNMLQQGIPPVFFSGDFVIFRAEAMQAAEVEAQNANEDNGDFTDPNQIGGAQTQDLGIQPTPTP